MATDIVLHYIKTQHFKTRQEERHISDTILVNALSKVKADLEDSKMCVIVSEKTLKEIRLLHPIDRRYRTGRNLIIAVAKKVLVTLYFTNDLKQVLQQHFKREKFVIV
jgi:hypothetical protein